MRLRRNPMIACVAAAAAVGMFLGQRAIAQPGSGNEANAQINLEDKLRGLESELPNSADVGGNPIREQGAAPRNSRRAPAEAGSFSARVPADTGGFESDLPAQLLEICRCRVISRIVGPQKQTAVIRFTPVARELLGQGSLEVTLVRRGSTAEAVDVALAPDTRLRIAIHRIDPDRDDVELLLSGYEIRGARLDSDRLVVPVLERATRRVE